MIKIDNKYPTVNGLDIEFISLTKKIQNLWDALDDRVTDNKADILTNTTSISNNADDIATNATNISSKADKVGSDDIEITDSTKGLILNDGTDRWRITVDATGTLNTTKL